MSRWGEGKKAVRASKELRQQRGKGGEGTVGCVKKFGKAVQVLAREGQGEWMLEKIGTLKRKRVPIPSSPTSFPRC